MKLRTLIFLVLLSSNAYSATGCKVIIPAGSSICSAGSRIESVWPYTAYKSSCLARAGEWQNYCKASNPVTANFYENGLITGTKTVVGVPSTRCEVIIPEASSKCVKGTKTETASPYTTDKDRCLARAAEWQMYCGTKNPYTANFYVNGQLSATRSTPFAPRCEIYVPRCFNGKSGWQVDASGYWSADKDRCLSRAAEWQTYCKVRDSFTANFYSDKTVIASKVSNMYQSLDLPASRDLTGAYYYGYSNIDSRITWGSSYELQAYLANFRATRDPSYLAQFIVYAEYVLSQRDDKVGYNKGAKTWSSSNYTHNVPYATLVGDGMISYAFADFASLVLVKDVDLKKIEVPALGKNLETLAWLYYQVAEDALLAHQSELNTDGSYRAHSDSAGYFLDSFGASMSGWYELPFNQYLAMGRTIVKLAEVSKSEIYQNLAYKMAGRFLANISDRGGYPYWNYWSRYAAPLEDISHGHIDVDFLRLYYEAGLKGLKWSDISNISATFVKYAYQGNGAVSFDIMGQTPEASVDYRNGMSWMMLSNYNYNVKLIGIHAFNNLSSQGASYFSAGGYGAFVNALKKEFGGRTSFDSTCSLNSDCEKGICHPKTVTQIDMSTFRAESLVCQSWFANGHGCTNHFECGSGYCDFSAKNKILVLPGKLHERTLSYGVCAAK